MASEKLFKVLDEKLLSYLSIQCERNYYYFDGPTKKPLKEIKLNQLSSNYKLEDSNREWNIARKSNSLFLNIAVKIEGIVHLFYGDTKICYPQTILGIGLEWKAKESKIKYCKKLGLINNKMDDLSIAVDDIEIKNPDSDIEFRWFLYVHEPAKNNGGTKEVFANKEGLILSTKVWWSIIVSGNGSIFPIEEYSKIGNPLWSIRSSFVDWAEDDFSLDNVGVVFNPAHPLFKFINYGSEDFDEDIFKEVASSAIAALIILIINQAREKGDLELLSNDPTEASGSILAAMRYFKSVHDFAVNGKVDELVCSIKTFFDKERSL